MIQAERARYGAAAYAGLTGSLPTAFPRTIGANAGKYLQEIVESGLTCDMTGRFERAFAAEMGVRHCVATPGCTPALAVLAAALGGEPGDEVIVSPITDYGTVQGIIREGYIPVFADTDPGSVNVGASGVEACLTDRTRAILLVHMTGLVCDMDPILQLAERRGLPVYEDVCQAVFSEYRGRVAGTLGNAAAFSFDGEKTMGSDTGGCVVTDDDALAERLRFLGHSRAGVMEPGFGRKHVAAGYAHRMPACTAAICLAQLEIIREQVRERDLMARLLSARIAEVPGVRALAIPEYQDVYSCWMFGISVEAGQFRCTPAEFAAELAAEGIPGAGRGEYYLMPAALPFLSEKAEARAFPYSLPPASRTYRYDAGTCPQAREFLRTFIRWSTFCEKYRPEHCELAAEIIRRVAERNRK